MYHIFKKRAHPCRVILEHGRSASVNGQNGLIYVICSLSSSPLSLTSSLALSLYLFLPAPALISSMFAVFDFWKGFKIIEHPLERRDHSILNFVISYRIAFYYELFSHQTRTRFSTVFSLILIKQWKCQPGSFLFIQEVQVLVVNAKEQWIEISCRKKNPFRTHHTTYIHAGLKRISVRIVMQNGHNFIQ